MYLRSKGFDGVRIWPNLTGPVQLMRSDGSLRPDGLSTLKFILDRARDERLVVDVSFTAEHVAGLDAARLRDAIVATTGELRGYENILFDIRTSGTSTGRSASRSPPVTWRVFALGIKSVDARRIVTASNSSENTAEETAAFVSQVGVDVAAYHDPRTSHFFDPSWIKLNVDALKASGRLGRICRSRYRRDTRRFRPASARTTIASR